MLPTEAVIRNLLEAQANLRVDFAADYGQRPLVLPESEFFPDVFSPNEQGAKRLVARMQHHAGLLDIPLTTRVIGANDAPSAAQCGSGACAPKTSSGDFERLVDTGDEWILQLPQQELHHAVALTTTVARALALVFLQETQRKPLQTTVPAEVLVDLSAVNLGFGALLMEGAYIYQKSCGGPQVAQLTALSVAELAVLVAFFAHGDQPALKRAQRSLGTTQAAALRAAVALANGNQELVGLLRNAPELLLAGVFSLQPPKEDLFGWLTTPFRRQKSSDPADPLLAAAEFDLALAPAKKNKASATTKRKPDDELSALVSEVLENSAR